MVFRNAILVHEGNDDKLVKIAIDRFGRNMIVHYEYNGVCICLKEVDILGGF